MNDVNHQDDDTKAGAALPELDKRLTWSEINMGWNVHLRQPRITLLSKGGDKSYMVYHDTPAAFLLAINPSYVSPTPYSIMNVSNNKDVPPRQYPTTDAAKDACEHHNATGNWEPNLGTEKVTEVTD